MSLAIIVATIAEAPRLKCGNASCASDGLWWQHDGNKNSAIEVLPSQPKDTLRNGKCKDIRII